MVFGYETLGYRDFEHMWIDFVANQEGQLIAIDRKKKLLLGISGIVIVVICAVLFYFLYWVKTPDYSLGLVKTAVEKHDLQTFEQHVDLKAVYGRGIDELLKSEMGDSDAGDNTLFAGMITLFKENMVKEMVSGTEKYVETGEFEKAEKNKSETDNAKQETQGLRERVNTPNLKYDGVTNTEKNGKIAVVTIAVLDTQLDQKFNVNIKMRELDNGEWQVVEISDLVDFVDEHDKAVQKKLAELNQPIKAEMEEAFALTGNVKAKLVGQNSFFPIYYIDYQINFKLPDKTKQVSQMEGTLYVKDKNGKDVMELPAHIRKVENLYKKSDYTTDKIFTNEWKSEKSLNPFINKEIQIAKNGIKNYELTFVVQKLTFTDGTILQLLKDLPNDTNA